MKEIFADTNIFMRLFETSDKTQTDIAKTLFEQASQGKIHLVIGPPVLFELSWVLKSAMNWSNSDILGILEAIIAWKGLRILDREYVERAISLAQDTKQGFADAYIVVTAKSHDLEVATFNQKHFAKLGATLYQLNSRK